MSSASILSSGGASASIHVLLTSCWFVVQGKHSNSCSRPPPEPSISTGAWNLGEREGRRGRERGEERREGGGERERRGGKRRGGGREREGNKG